MRIGIIGAGNIGGNVARQAARAGHSLTLSFARDQRALQRLADELQAAVGSPADAVDFGEIVVVAVPWSALPEAIAAASDFRQKIVVDTTNQFGSGPMPSPPRQSTSSSTPWYGKPIVGTCSAGIDNCKTFLGAWILWIRKYISIDSAATGGTLLRTSSLTTLLPRWMPSVSTAS
jgi:hypothetical protein